MGRVGDAEELTRRVKEALEKVTGESLSSYYEEQKGGKKVEIGGKKESGWGGGTRW